MNAIEDTADQTNVPPIVPPDVAAAAAADASTVAPSNDRSNEATIDRPIEKSVDYDAEARDLVEFAWASLGPLYPSLTPIYTADVRSRISATLAPLMRKYGLDIGRLGPELSFGITIVPLIAPTIQAIRYDRQAARAAATAERPAAAAASEAGEGKHLAAQFPGLKPDA